MTLFYLQTTERDLIDDRVHAGATVDQIVDADCWLAAKKAFGFELTALQEWLLAKKLDA